MIEFSSYQTSWPSTFEAEAQRLRRRLGDRCVRVDHVGSTAVPRLSAKPIIDIQVSMTSLADRDFLERAMHELGFAHVDLGAFDLIYPFFKRPKRWPSSHHVHLCQSGGEQERKHLAFRDYLRRHPEAATAYEREKRRLAQAYRGDTNDSREQYSLAKTLFIEAILKLAAAEGLPDFGSREV